MNDFLTRLAQRQLGQIASVEPRLPELYAPVTAATVADGPRVMTRPTQAIKANPSPGPEPLVSTLRQERPGPVAIANVAQPSVTKNSAAPAPSFADNVGSEAGPPPGQNLDTQASRIEFAVAPPASKQTDSLPTRPQARVADGASMPSAPPSLMGTQAAPAVAAPPHLMSGQTAPALTAPPRLETKAPTGFEVVAGDRNSGDAEPPIQVTIGRIEVTALTQAAPAKRAAAPRKPAMSLDDYLARRQRRQP